jgi:hypothetical protein
VWQCQTGQKELGGINNGEIDGNNRLPPVIFNATEALVASHSSPEHSAWWKTTWEHIVRNYSSRELTRKADRLRSIAGIAAKFRTAFPGIQYLAGLWHEEGMVKSYLLPQLVWSRRGISRDFPDYPEGRPADARKSPADPLAPSWSWASVDDGVLWMVTHSRENASKYPGEVLDCYVEPMSLLNPFGRANGGTVTLRAPFRKVKGILKRGNQIWEFRIGEVNDAYPRFRCQYSRVSPEVAGQTIEVYMLHLIECAGIIIQSTAAEGMFLRVGTFNFRQQPDIAKSFFSKAENGVFTLI